MTDTQSSKPAVAFLGLGYMGSRMARRVLDAGYPLTVWNRSRDKTGPLVDAGARAADTAAEAVQNAEVVISSLADDVAAWDCIAGGGRRGCQPQARRDFN